MEIRDRMPAEADPGLPDRSEFADAPLLRGEVAFRLLVDAVEDYAIFLLGPDGRVLTWNLGAQRIKGYTSEEIVGQHFSIFYAPEERDAGRPDTVLAAAAEFGRFEDEGWRIRKDGSRFWADVIITALRDESGEPYAFAKVTRDMTERREAEARERMLAGEQQARAAAEEALKARDRFLSIASHELKTPVASLQLAAESLVRARRSGTLTDDRLDAGLARLSRSTLRLATLVEELLDVSRLTADQRTIELAPTDVVALVREVIDAFDADGRDGGRVKLTSADEVWIDADAGRLEQVLVNLIDNALKYSTPPASVEVQVHEAENGVEISVIDEGIGLDQGMDGRIFEAFGRGRNAQNIKGLGLGLFISRELIARHGGQLEARSHTGARGATFTIRLPREGPSG